MHKKTLQSMILASIILFNGSSCPKVSAAISETTYSGCYSAGEKAYALSDYTLAAENFAEALKYKPDDLRSRLKYAQSLYSMNKYDESIDNLQRVLQNSPNNIIARINLAENYIKLDKKEDAKEQLKWVLKTQPNHVKAKTLFESIESAPAETAVENQNILVPAEKAVDSENNREEIAKNEKVELPASQNVANEIKVIEPSTAEKVEKVENSESIKGKESVSIEKEESSILNNSETMTFTPYIAGQNQKAKAEEKSQTKPRMPEARIINEKISMESFFKAGKDSFIVNIEKARYEIEKGDLKSAEKTLELADKYARAGKSGRNILEVQIFKSLVYIYKCEFQNFGKHLMTLKTVLSPDTYQSFLDIYAKSDELKDAKDKRRLSAGVAMGAGHFTIASDLLKPVFEDNPDDPILYSMLSEAQLNSFDYDGAENTLKKFAEIKSDNAEAQFNLARFYLTGNYDVDLAKKYANLAAELNPEDARCKIILALADYSEGNINQGITKIKELLPSLEDTSMKAICQRLIKDGEKASNDSAKNFISMLALPGSKHADLSSFRFSGEDDLLAGSYFSAMAKFEKADEKVEMGRVYLGLASALNAANEIEMASIAAGYGLKLINEDMAKGKHLARASLYKALYDYERGDKDSAIASIDVGMNSKDLDYSTYNKLVSLYDSL